MYYTPSELYEGNKDGLPLDPVLYDLSMKFHFGGGNQQPAAPKPAVQANATAASAGKGVMSIMQSGKAGKKRNLASLFIKRNYKPRQISSLYGGSFAGAGRTPNIGTFG